MQRPEVSSTKDDVDVNLHFDHRPMSNHPNIIYTLHHLLHHTVLHSPIKEDDAQSCMDIRPRGSAQGEPQERQ